MTRRQRGFIVSRLRRWRAGGVYSGLGRRSSASSATNDDPTYTPPSRHRGASQTNHRFLITQDVVGEQFRALEREDVSHAYKFVHESIKEQYSLDVDRYEQIFKGAAYDGLLGCASRTVHKSNFAPDFTARFAHRSWKVTALSPSPIDDDRTVASMTVLPKPVPGCVRVAGVAGQQGITWPTFYKWELRKQTDGCWMIENMTPEPPPIDTVATDATPLLESESATAAP